MSGVLACGTKPRARQAALRVLCAVALGSLASVASAADEIELQLIEQALDNPEALMVAPALLPLNGSDTLAFTQVEMAGPADIVPGRPYSARLRVVKHQRLADGNAIIEEQHGRIYRDAAGRTRREDAVSGRDARRHQVLITDPVAAFSVLLFPDRRVAMHLTPPRTTETTLALAVANDHGVDVAASTPLAVAATRMAADDDFVISLPLPGAPVTVALGERRIEGLRALGTRTTLDIPAAAIGNREPIAIVTEQWYSPELDVVVSSEHRDPRVGTTRYTLHAIERGDPEPGLFRIPADYALTESLR